MLNQPIDSIAERLITLSELAEKLGVPLFAVRRAASRGEFPTYRIGNGRCRVRLSEVVAAVDRTKQHS
jgi:excisionase family DNA binding protein